MSSPNTQFVIAGIVLDGFAIPERVGLGGRQGLTVHQLPGGVRVVDAMGPEEAPITWSGIILGGDADNLAQQIDNIRRAGTQVTLTFASHSYAVVISEFKYEFERYYNIPYQITCTVVQDLSAPPRAARQPSSSDYIVWDNTNVLGVAEGLDMEVPSTLPGPVSTVSGQVFTQNTDIVAPPQSVTGGVDLQSLAVALTAMRRTVSVSSGITNPSAGAVAATAVVFETTLRQIVADQRIADAALEIDDTQSNTVANVVTGYSGTVNAARFAAYQPFALQDPQLVFMGGSVARMIDNLNLGNGGTNLAALDWNNGAL